MLCFHGLRNFPCSVFQVCIYNTCIRTWLWSFRKSWGGICQILCVFLMAFIRDGHVFLVLRCCCWGNHTYLNTAASSHHHSIQILMGIPATWCPTSTPSKKSNKSLGLTERQWWFIAALSTSDFWGKVIALRCMFPNMLHIYQLNLTKFKIQMTRPTAGGRW